MFGFLSVIFVIAGIIFGGGWALGANIEFPSRALIFAITCLVAAILCGYASHKKDEF